MVAVLCLCVVLYRAASMPHCALISLHPGIREARIELLESARQAVTQVPVCCAVLCPRLTASRAKAAWPLVQVWVCLLSAAAVQQGTVHAPPCSPCLGGAAALTPLPALMRLCASNSLYLL